jgi:hypothetical protein
MARSDVRPLASVTAGSTGSGKRRRSVLAAVALTAITIAPLAFAQTATTTPKKKKGAKPAASASASASASAAPSATASSPPPPPAEDKDTDSDTTTAKPEPAKPAGESAESVEEAKEVVHKLEDPNKPYYYVGVRYRGTVIPAFLEHLFVNDGGTIYSNTIGLEAERRKDGNSMIGWIAFTEYGFGNTLFWQKGEPDSANEFSIVNSSLKGLYLGLDESWTIPINPDLAFEYGFGIGLGVIFGSLLNDWVNQSAQGNPGAVKGSDGNYYVPCQAQSDGPSCLTTAHQNASVAKVGNYVEPNWLNGGPVPVIFPHISIPQLALRYKPIPEFQARLSLGFSITGFWFGLSADYGLEQRPRTEKAAPTPSEAPSSQPAHAHPHEHQDSGDDTL